MSQQPPDFDMNIFFQESQGTPLPPKEVRILEFEAIPWGEERPIVKISLHLTPFLRRPSAEIRMHNPQGEIVAEASIFGTMTPNNEINMHPRGNVTSGTYTVSCTLFYERKPKNQEPDDDTYIPPEIMVVDRAQATFDLSFQ